jgi:hypothetical protein
MLKNAELKLSCCGLQKKLRLRNCGVVVADQNFFKSCGIVIAEVLPSSCGIAIANSKKSCVCPPLLKIPRTIQILEFLHVESHKADLKKTWEVEWCLTNFLTGFGYYN